jgi:hypothetical protein
MEIHKAVRAENGFVGPESIRTVCKAEKARLMLSYPLQLGPIHGKEAAWLLRRGFHMNLSTSPQPE